MDFPPRTIGMIPASQASFRAWAAVIGSPVSNTAGVWLSPSRFSTGLRCHHGLQPTCAAHGEPIVG